MCFFVNFNEYKINVMNKIYHLMLFLSTSICFSQKDSISFKNIKNKYLNISNNGFKIIITRKLKSFKTNPKNTIKC